MSTIQLDVNDDGQLVIDEFDHRGQRCAFTAPYSRADTLRLAAEILGSRVIDGTIDCTKTIDAFCLEHGAIRHRWDQDDRVLTEGYVNNDTGET